MTELPAPNEPEEEPGRSDPAEQPEPAAQPESDETGEWQPTSAADGIDPDLSDDQLLAAASAFLHDEPDMEQPTPGADDADSSGSGDGAPSGAGPLPPPPPPGPPASYPPPVRRLYRSRHDRRLGGVCGGIAEFFGIDPTLVRFATLVAAFTGIGILVYLAAWIIVPRRPEGLVDAPRAAPVANERSMVLALRIGALALIFGIVTGSWALVALALIASGVWLLSEHTAVAPAMAGAAPTPGVANYQPPGGFEPGYVRGPTTGSPFPRGTGFVPPPRAAAPVEHRQPQRVTWAVLSLLALLLAVGLADVGGNWWDSSATRLLGAGIVIIGIGVVVGQLGNGGARGLIPLGLLAALALFPVSAVDGLLDEGVGEANFRPTTIAELESTYEHGIGEMTVDLSELDFEGRNDRIDIDLGIGELVVVVSDQIGGEAELQAKAGEISHGLGGTVGSVFQDGINIETGTVTLPGENGMVDLHIDVGLGTAELRIENG